MTPHRWIIWTASLAASISMLGWSGTRAMREHNRHREAEQEAEQVRLAVQRVLTAEAGLPEAAFRGRPDLSAMRSSARAEAGGMAVGGSDGGLATRIDAALKSAGVPTQALTSLQPDAEAVLAQTNDRATAGGAPSAQVRRVQAVLVLETLTLPQLGKVFDALRRREPDWTVASIDLSPMAIAKNSAGPQVGGRGRDAPLRAVVTIRTEFLTPPLPRVDVESSHAQATQAKPQP